MKKVLSIVCVIIMALAMTVNVHAESFVDAWEYKCDYEIETADFFEGAVLSGFETRVFIDADKVASLIESIKEDRKNISFDEISTVGWGFNIDVRYVPAGEEYLCERMFRIDGTHKNTIEWVKENGLWEYVEIKNEAPIYIIKNASFFPYMDFWDKKICLNFESYELKGKFYDEDAQKVLDYIEEASKKESGGEYLVYQVLDEETSEVRYVTTLSALQVDELMK